MINTNRSDSNDLLDSLVEESNPSLIAELLDSNLEVTVEAEITTQLSEEDDIVPSNTEEEDNLLNETDPILPNNNLAEDPVEIETQITPKLSVIEDDVFNTEILDDPVNIQLLQNKNLIQGDEDRFEVRDSIVFKDLVAPIVRIQTSNGGWGTGVMIGEYSVLTAAHVVQGLTEADITVTPSDPDSDNKNYGTAKVKSIRIDPSYSGVNDLASDLAVLNLDRNLGNHTNWYSYGYHNDSVTDPSDNWWEDETFYTAGYPFDLSNGTKLYAESLIINETQSLGNVFISKTGDVASGQSGSPLWYHDGVVYGVVAGFNNDGMKSARITQEKFNFIGDAIKTDSRPFDKPDFVDYDKWFDTNIAYFKHNQSNSSSQSNNSIEITAGDYFTVSSRIRNNGTATYDGLYVVPPSINVSFYAELNTPTIPGTPRFRYHLGDVSVSSINPFEWENVTLTGDLPDIPSGNYFISWEIDSKNAIEEFEESNNTGKIDNFSLVVKETEELSEFGSEGDDTIYGQNKNDTLYGLGGKDILFGKEGDDLIYGGNDNDFISGQEGEDRLYGQGGNDIILGWAGNDELFGMEDDDVLDGYSPFKSDDPRTAEFDTLTGGTGADTFVLGWDSSNYQGAYYLGEGYAIITDFDWEEGDKIKAYSGFGDYSLEYSQEIGSEEQDTIVRYQGDIIAILQDDTTLDVLLDFDFV